MGYVNYNRLRINKKKDNRKNPVATITIPYSIIESLKWRDGDLISFEPFSTKTSQDVTMVNLNRCPKDQMGGKFVKLIGDSYKKRIDYEKMLRGFPLKTQKQLRKFIPVEKFKK